MTSTDVTTEAGTPAGQVLSNELVAAVDAPAAEVAAAAVDAAPAREAAVLGVSLERSAPAVAGAGLARTGIELTTMLLVAVSLLLGGIVLTRRGAAKRSA